MSRGVKRPTKAAGSQSTDTESKGGQNKPDPGGKAGAGRAPGGAKLSPVGRARKK